MEEMMLDEMLGMFVRDFSRIGTGNDMLNQIMIYFVCRVREFFNDKMQDKSTSQRSAESVI